MTGNETSLQSEKTSGIGLGKLALALAAALAAVPLPDQARAATVTILQPFSLSSPFGQALGGESLGFAAFNSSLGTLDAVLVLLEFQNLQFEILRAPDVPTVPRLDLRIDKGQSGFETEGTAAITAVFDDVGPPANPFQSEWKLVRGSFGLSFTFDTATDAAGKVVPSVLSGSQGLQQVLLTPITGTRGMFLNFSTETLYFNAGNSFSYRDFSGVGQLSVYYQYTPATPPVGDPGTSIPEPATLALVLAGFALVIARFPSAHPPRSTSARRRLAGVDTQPTGCRASAFARCCGRRPPPPEPTIACG